METFKKLIDFKSQGKAFDLAIPTPKHYLPPLYTWALKEENEKITLVNDKPVGAHQLKETKIMDTNEVIWLQSESNSGINIQSEHSIMDDFVVRGPLLEQYSSQRKPNLI